jgi:hypothetical protein
VGARFDDARQEGVLTFWDLYRRKGSEEYAFVGAKYALMNFPRGKSPYRCLSLDANRDRYDSPREECLLVARDQHDGWDNGGGNVVSNAGLERAVAALEYDGVHHVTDPKQQRRDRLKD